MLNVNDIACERNDQLLFSGLTFTLTAGEILQIAGPNGAGKTSLLRLLAGLAKPCAGQVLWQQKAVSRQREAWHAQLLWIGHRAGIKSTMTADEKPALLPPALRSQPALAGAGAGGAGGL
ncbi:Cytochrome c biogenesis ATP-binding export protein CcmA [Pluralibacter gergoviae]|nr:Cytochrome c biogenesis ATP-binding export protein CcmA [Pluralibacter gergoviae]